MGVPEQVYRPSRTHAGFCQQGGEGSALHVRREMPNTGTAPFAESLVRSQMSARDDARANVVRTVPASGARPKDLIGSAVRMRRPMIDEPSRTAGTTGSLLTGVSLSHGTSDADSPRSQIHGVPGQLAKLRDPHAGQYKGRENRAPRDVITVALVRPRRSRSRGDGPWKSARQRRRAPLQAPGWWRSTSGCRRPSASQDLDAALRCPRPRAVAPQSAPPREGTARSRSRNQTFRVGCGIDRDESAALRILGNDPNPSDDLVDRRAIETAPPPAVRTSRVVEHRLGEG